MERPPVCLELGRNVLCLRGFAWAQFECGRQKGCRTSLSGNDHTLLLAVMDVMKELSLVLEDVENTPVASVKKEPAQL